MILLQLLLAHLLGDFLFQPNSWVADKEKKKIRSKFLYFHILLHFILLLLCLWSWEYIWLALSISVLHYVIDLIKLYFQTIKTKKYWFFIDQFLHLLVIFAFAKYIDTSLNFPSSISPELMKILIGFIVLSTPASIIVKLLISQWTPETKESKDLEQNHSLSLQNAGKYIGILERILIYIFIIMNHWEGVGFMIAAKSIFRFSDLAQAKQRKLTEYIMIGTLLSFGIAIVCGILVTSTVL